MTLFGYSAKYCKIPYCPICYLDRGLEKLEKVITKEGNES